LSEVSAFISVVTSCREREREELP